MRKLALITLLITALIGSAVQAQTDSEAFITINLNAGFVLDPFVVSVNGGGDVDASTLDASCTGYISSAPTVQVNWTGEAEFLQAFFFSDHDPVLVVQLPDGSYVCSDDESPLILDPAVAIENPQSGLYSVWVGSFAPDQLLPGFLVFSANPNLNVASFDIGSLVRREPVTEMADESSKLPVDTLQLTASASVSLSPGSDPVTQEITATGDVPLFDIDQSNDACTGFIDETPNFAFNWSGTTESLSVFFEADLDTTLLVVTPSGEFICNDDTAGSSNLNPLVTLANPEEGDYLVFVGRFDPQFTVSGTLTVTESADAEPAPLAVELPEAIAPSESEDTQ